MKFDMLCLPTVPATYEDRVRMRPIGRNRERVQQMYEEVIEICVAADEAGFHAFSTTEHHFHTEGFELSPSPLVLYSHLAGLCDRIAFAPLGMVLTTWDPIRLAEELAVLDHLTKGRLFVGLARGYQPRWTQVLGQPYDVKGATMDGSAVDLQNREVFDEMFDVLMKAWTEETFTHDGRYYKAPYPIEGIEPWIVHELTQELGAPGEVDDAGRIVRTSVCPTPYQDPHPPFWQGYAASESTVVRCAQNGITPFLLVSKPEMFNAWCRTFQEVAAAQGRTLRLGQQVGVVRSVTFGNSYEEAFELGVETTGVVFEHYFRRFGFMELFRRESDDPSFPLDLGGPRGVFQRLVEDGHALVGTVDDIKRGVEAVSTCHGGGELDWFAWSFYQQGLASRSDQQKQLALFAENILPEFAD